MTCWWLLLAAFWFGGSIGFFTAALLRVGRSDP